MQNGKESGFGLTKPPTLSVVGLWVHRRCTGTLTVRTRALGKTNKITPGISRQVTYHNITVDQDSWLNGILVRLNSDQNLANKLRTNVCCS